ncbi:MAG: tripartite tricarboxylate transporter substrate binding protein [Rhodoferax sp.]|nr:tripartite tricarboxylate transporter substrate binding protein [Rhodoferax sp.]
MLASFSVSRRAGAFLVAGLLAACALPLAAQDWPNRPIKLIVPHSPGGATDAVARLVAQPLGEALGQSIVVDNKPGAGGILGTDLAALAPADGYTLLMLVDANTVYPSTKLKLNHDPAASFAPISLIGRGSHVVVLHPSVPANNLQELIAYIRAKPGELSCALPGANSPQHLALEMIKAHAKIDVTPIPYKGGGQAITDIVGGQVKFGVLGMAPAVPHIKAGRLKAIAVTGSTRSGALPDVPTVAESGIPGFETNQWQSMVAPAGTPPAIVNRIHAELVKIMQMPAVKDKLATIGMDNSSSASPAALGTMIRAELDRWPGVVKSAGIKPE